MKAKFLPLIIIQGLVVKVYILEQNLANVKTSEYNFCVCETCIRKILMLWFHSRPCIISQL